MVHVAVVFYSCLTRLVLKSELWSLGVFPSTFKLYWLVCLRESYPWPYQFCACSPTIRYKIDVVNKTCDCGEWQDHGVPCIDAIAYFKLHKHMLLQNMLFEEVDWHYTYEHERCLLKNNIVPVCMERLYHDGSTLPPMASTKRTTGRPKKQRIRKRSRWAHDPEKSNIKCSGCHQRGHNIRTCLTRKALAGQGATKNNTQELDLS